MAKAIVRTCTLLLLIVQAALANVLYSESFKLLKQVECGGVYRLSALSEPEQEAMDICMEQCFRDSDCGGFNYRSKGKASVCEFLTHVGVSVECYNHQATSAVVRGLKLMNADTRKFVSVSTIQETLQLNLRCSAFSVTNGSQVYIAAQEKLANSFEISKISEYVQNAADTCTGNQLCNINLRLQEFFPKTGARYEALRNELLKISIELHCQAGITFNEDVYFNSWSSTHWLSSLEQSPRRRALWKNYLDNTPVYQASKFSGRGAIIVAGGPYLEPALVLALRLREMGFNYPIQFWHLGADEVWPSTKPLLRQLDIETKDFQDFVDQATLAPIPANVGLRRFQLKPLALLHSNLKEILILDADNIPIRNPAYLFDSPEFQSTGALFWPDYWTTSLQNPIWDVIGKAPVTEWEQESGQLLIDKERSWRALHLCVHMNNEFYMRLVNGDKDSFRFAWKASQTPYHMISTWPSTVGVLKEPVAGKSAICGHTMLQHDTTGSPLFVHHNQLKDLVFAVGSNFKAVQDRARACRAVPKPGFQYGGKVVPCFEFQGPGLTFVDDTHIPVNMSHLEVFEMRYASALRTVRAMLKPDRIRQMRNRKSSNNTNTNQTFFVDSVTSERASVCSPSQNETSEATNSTDRFCTNSTVEFITYSISVGPKTSSHPYYLTGASQGYFVTKLNITTSTMESPILSLCFSLSYQFLMLPSVNSSSAFIISSSAAGGSQASLASGVTGAPAVSGEAVTFTPQSYATAYYASAGQQYMGNRINVISPVWQKMFLSSTQPSRFNTAFSPYARLFELPDSSQESLVPTDGNVVTLTSLCQAQCMSSVSCLGVYVYRTSMAVKCYGLSDLGAPTASLLDGQSWKKVEP